MASIIRLQQLSKSYDRGRVEALQAIDLEVQEGEIFGLVGPDGAGKSTLFRLLATLFLPSQGHIEVDGLDAVRDYRQLRQLLGYMPGRFSLYPDLTVEENLQFFAAIFGVNLEDNYRYISDMYAQIRPFRDRPAGKLSGGMKQKLALCCALIHAPRVLLLDEPTTGVDPVSRRELWAMLRRLNAELSLTIVVSTPYREEVMQCHRIALMSQGRIDALGAPAEVLPAEVGVEGEGRELADVWAIDVEGLTKRFGDFVACDHISFQVRRGEIFGFLGANGAGKTTAMRMLCGLSQPTEGRAIVGGVDVGKDPELVKLQIGYMSQKFALYDDLTVA